MAKPLKQCRAYWT